VLCCVVNDFIVTVLVAVADSDDVPVPWTTGIRDGHPLYVVVSELGVPFTLPF